MSLIGGSVLSVANGNGCVELGFALGDTGCLLVSSPELGPEVAPEPRVLGPAGAEEQVLVLAEGASLEFGQGMLGGAFAQTELVLALAGGFLLGLLGVSASERSLDLAGTQLDAAVPIAQGESEAPVLAWRVAPVVASRSGQEADHIFSIENFALIFFFAKASASVLPIAG